MGGGDKGGKKATWGQVFSWSRDMGVEMWRALKRLRLVLQPIINLIKGIIDWVKVIWGWVKPWIDWILNTYKTYIKPWIDYLRDIVEVIHHAVVFVRDGLDGLVKELYRKWFPEIEEARAAIKELFTKTAEIVSVFDEKLANKIIETRDEFLATIDKYSRDLRDWALDKIHDVFDPILHKVNEITILLEGFIRSVEDRFRPIIDLISKTFERPQVLRRETMERSGRKWGYELWSSMFEGSSPPLTPREERELRYEPPEDWGTEIVRKTLELQDTEWKDVTDAAIDTAIRMLKGAAIF